jgi:hypothetical protein
VGAGITGPFYGWTVSEVTTSTVFLYMAEFSIFHWLVVLAVLLGIFLLVTLLVYRHAKKVGDEQGYIRDYKEAQQSIDVRTKVSAILNERPRPTIRPQVLAARVLGDSEMHAELRVALRSMRNQRIPFTGPFRTANGQIVVATGKFLLTGNELIELMDRGQLDASGIEALVGTLNGHKKNEDQCDSSQTPQGCGRYGNNGGDRQ